MKHGPESIPGGTIFRLWAPAAENVELLYILRTNHDRTPTDKHSDLHQEPQRAMMNSVADGWHELWIRGATPGTLYRFKVGELDFPDPASKFQPDDIYGYSEVINLSSRAKTYQNPDNFPWKDSIIYEIHTGSFTEEGTYAGITNKLDYLQDLGINVIELMPISDFPGKRNWGYDGVLPFAPDSIYGRPEQLQDLIEEVHKRKMKILLDVVYNHFGPEGNYLHTYAPHFFTDEFDTLWGAAIDFSHREVRNFFIQNALYWLNDYQFDGLRFDAVHAIFDKSDIHILDELAEKIRESCGQDVDLILENDDNASRYLNLKKKYNAQWNDDIHHVFHILASGESSGYYIDYADKPLEYLGQCLTQGFAYQGQWSNHRKSHRGEKSAHLAPESFIGFLQNHDQIGNRAKGERLHFLVDNQRQLDALTAIMLLSPQIPMVFMGEEWRSSSPFLFFCDFHEELASAVRNGRKNEFAAFPEFNDPEVLDSIPDPNSEETFRNCILDWENSNNIDFYRSLIKTRKNSILPLQIRSGHVAHATNKSMMVHFQLFKTNQESQENLIYFLSTDNDIFPADLKINRMIYQNSPFFGVNSEISPWTVYIFTGI